MTTQSIDITILNTIELSPSDFAKEEYELPAFDSANDREEWSQYWYRCLSDSGLGDVIPVELGSWFVDINRITDPQLHIIVQRYLRDVDADNYQEQVTWMYGGLAIKKEEQVIISPSCCGDMRNLHEGWEEIERTDLDTWTILYIGHPWLHYRRRDGYIEFSDYTEKNLNDTDVVEVKHVFDEEQLFAELKRIRAEQNHV